MTPNRLRRALELLAPAEAPQDSNVLGCFYCGLTQSSELKRHSSSCPWRIGREALAAKPVRKRKAPVRNDSLSKFWR